MEVLRKLTHLLIKNWVTQLLGTANTAEDLVENTDSYGIRNPLGASFEKGTG